MEASGITLGRAGRTLAQSPCPEDDDHMGGASAASFGLFGREDAMGAMGDVLDVGGSAVATGEPGTGKSSLLTVVDQLAQRRGHRVLSVTPTQFDQGLPFAGLAELLAQCPEGAEKDLPGPQQRALAVALHRVEPAGDDVDALAVPLAVRGLLTQLSATETVTLIIDDLQWLDPASLGSLGFALRRISVEPHRLSVLVGTRPDPGAGTDLIRALPEPRREFPLAPLEDWAIGQLLRSRLGSQWTTPMSFGVARASGGNPFLALMIAQAIDADAPTWRGTTQHGHDQIFPLPPSLAELLGKKVALLPQHARDVLLLVSAAGRLTVTQLQGIVEATRLRSALEAAADVVVAVVGAEAVVTFTHPLLASAIYDAASPAERRRAHQVLAEKLDDPVERARHRSRTVMAPDESVALELQQAAAISRARGAQHLVGELLERAARTTPSITDTVTCWGRWLRAVDAYLVAGDRVAAETTLDGASVLATEPEQQAEVLIRRLRLSDQHSGDRALAEQALLLAPKGTEIRAEVLRGLGTTNRMQGNGSEALHYMRMAVREAAELKRFDLQLIALNERLAIEQHWGQGRPQQTLRDIERLVGRAASDLPAEQVAWTQGFFASWNDESAEEKVRAGIRLAVEAGRYGELSNLYICLVLVLTRSSRAREARTALDEADRLGAWSASSLQEDMARVLVTEYSGELAAARDLAQSAAARSRVTRSTYWLAGFLAQLGFVEISAGDWAAALDALREVAEIFESTGMVDLEQLLWAVDYADAALQVGSLQEVELAISVLRRQGAAGRPEARVAADRVHALLKAAHGDVEGALTELVRIVGQRESECPFESARSLLALGQVHRRAGNKRMASETLNAAAAAFEDLGIPRWAEKARDQTARVGLHRTTGELTASERSVAELVGSGHTNQEVAAALFMSVKTVEANLTRIYRKLSVRSRTELANRLNQFDSKS